MGLASYVVRRLLLIIPVLFGVTFLSFIISHVVVPDPAIAWAGPKASPQTLAAISAQYHFGDPLYVQYWYYIRNLLTGDWGVSPTTHVPVLQAIGEFFPATLELSIVALIISVVIGIPTGVFSALLRGKKLDYPVRLIYLSGIASPPFLLALIAQLAFSYYFHILPSSGRLSANMQPPPHITGLYLVDSLLTGNWNIFADAAIHLILPATALALLTFAIIARITRSSVLETMNKDFVRTAKAKGLTGNQITFRHILRNALISTVTVIGLAVQFVLFGTIVIETIFFWPGIGLYATDSILSLDFPAIMGVTVLFTLIVVFTNLVTDVAYGFLDPTVRLE